MATVTLARRAMATFFEVVLHGERESYLQAVAEECLNEIDRIETLLSFYRSDSETRRVNVLAVDQPVPVDPRFFALVEQARELSELTGGAFDITVAPLMKAWGFIDASGAMPDSAAIEAARARVGMNHVIADPDACTIRFDRDGVMLDFGAIGKGYAIERAVDVLREYEIESALIHGGTSTVYALGNPPESDTWTIAVQSPPGTSSSRNLVQDANSDTGSGSELVQIALCNESLSVSAPHGKAFDSGGRRYGHVLDPRTGYPTANDNLLAALVCDSPTESDALSTALLTLGPDWLPPLARLRPEAKALIIHRDVENAVHVASLSRL